MKIRVLIAALALWMAIPAFAASERTLDFGEPFGTVTLYMPEGKPKAAVIFLSGDGAWKLGVIDMARHLRDQGAAVVGVNVLHYLANIAAGKDKGGCRYMAADFEALSHRFQREMGLSEYLVPLIYGYSSGATVAYAALVQSPPGTFGGAVSLGFCPDQKFGGAALCPGPGAKLTYKSGDKGAWVFDPAPKLTDRWVAFQGEIDTVCSPETVDKFAAQVGNSEVVHLPHVGHGYSVEKNWLPQFQDTFEKLSQQAKQPAITSPDIADLPLVEQPVTGNPSAPLVVMLTGDGGWAGLDRGLATAFNEHGMPVVALSTLQYFWHTRTPEESAGDVARVIQHYLVSWQRERVLLVGYSFGADVLPFIVNRLPENLRMRVVSVNMLGLEANATFEIHVTGWLPGVTNGNKAIKPEIEKMRGIDALCLYGSGENNDPCRTMAGGSLSAEELGQGHHFGGEYDELAAAMLKHAGLAASSDKPVQ